MKKLSLFIGIVFMLVISASLVCAQEQKTVKVGVISPHSGPVAYFGLSVYRSVELAVKNINEKGPFESSSGGILVGGQRSQLEVVSYDDGGNPAKSVAGMRRLVEMYKVPVIFGPFGTPTERSLQRHVSFRPIP